MNNNPKRETRGDDMFIFTTTQGLETRTMAESRRLLEKIGPYSTVREYHKGEKVIIHGDDAASLYYVEEGVVEVSYTSHSTRVIVALIGPGEFFGEIGFFDGMSRVRDIHATKKTVVRVWGQENVKHMKEEASETYAEFLMQTARSVCRKFRRVLEEREPLKAYAASLSTGRRQFYNVIAPVPDDLYDMEIWKEVHAEVEEFKARMYDLANAVQIVPYDNIPDKYFTQCNEVIEKFNDKLERLDKTLEEGRLKEYLLGYVFKEIFPYFMRSRFAQRTYFKPKGYAGDFLMMEAIYRNTPDGDGNLGLMIDAYCLQCPPAKAVRGRRRMLAKLLERYSGPLIEQGRRVHIMNLACGSNRELFDFLKRCPDTSKIEAICMDADQDALKYTNKEVNIFPHEATIRLMKDNVVKWSLGRVRHEFGKQDIIYSAGLTDYLDERLFIALLNRIYDFLNPGGITIICNFAARYPHRAWVDQLLQWKLIYRDEEDMRKLFAKSRFGDEVELFTEEEGITVFAVARRKKEAV